MLSIGEQRSRTVLLAEDDEINQQIVRHILSDLPFIKLVVAGDGKEALEAALSQRFDLMIFDRNMPLITGDRVIRHLRASPSVNTDTPIIRFTADADHVSLSPDATQHADATIPKPIRPDVFKQTILRLLQLDGL